MIAFERRAEQRLGRHKQHDVIERAHEIGSAAFTIKILFVGDAD